LIISFPARLKAGSAEGVLILVENVEGVPEVIRWFSPKHKPPSQERSHRGKKITQKKVFCKQKSERLVPQLMEEDLGTRVKRILALGPSH